MGRRIGCEMVCVCQTLYEYLNTVSGAIVDMDEPMICSDRWRREQCVREDGRW